MHFQWQICIRWIVKPQNNIFIIFAKNLQFVYADKIEQFQIQSIIINKKKKN